MSLIQKKLDSSISWMLLTRFSVKILGLISSLILVRILSPSDFGLVAIAMSVYTLIQLFGSFGFNTAIIQKSEPTKSDYDTTFTINLLFGFVAAVIIVVLSSFLSDFFNDHRLESVFYFLAFLFALQGFQNIKVVDFQKHMDFRNEFKLQIIPKTISFILTLYLAWQLKSYWALIYGMIANAFFTIAYSYYVMPYTPSLQVKGWVDLFRFSKWLMFNNFLYYLNNSSITLIVGKAVSTEAVGYYSISQEMASIPVTEIAAPINKASFPAYSKVKDDPDVLFRLYYRTIALITLLALPASAGLFSVADYFVPVVLGDKWLNAVNIIKYLSVASFFTALTTNNGFVFIAKGNPKASTLISLFRVLVLFLFFFLFITPDNISSPAMAMMFAALINLLISFWSLKVMIGVSLIKTLISCHRAILSSLLMVFVIFVADQMFFNTVDKTIYSLMALVILGATSYVISIFVFWRLSGKPDTIEKTIFTKLKLHNKTQ